MKVVDDDEQVDKLLVIILIILMFLLIAILLLADSQFTKILPFFHSEEEELVEEKEEKKKDDSINILEPEKKEVGDFPVFQYPVLSKSDFNRHQTIMSKEDSNFIKMDWDKSKIKLYKDSRKFVDYIHKTVDVKELPYHKMYINHVISVCFFIQDFTHVVITPSDSIRILNANLAAIRQDAEGLKMKKIQEGRIPHTAFSEDKPDLYGRSFYFYTDLLLKWNFLALYKVVSEASVAKINSCTNIDLSNQLNELLSNAYTKTMYYLKFSAVKLFGFSESYCIEKEYFQKDISDISSKINYLDESHLTDWDKKFLSLTRKLIIIPFDEMNEAFQHKDKFDLVSREIKKWNAQFSKISFEEYIQEITEIENNAKTVQDLEKLITDLYNSPEWLIYYYRFIDLKLFEKLFETLDPAAAACSSYRVLRLQKFVIERFWGK